MTDQKNPYSVTERMTEYLNGQVDQLHVSGAIQPRALHTVTDIVDTALEYIGEMEHDPSISWPHEYENVAQMTDEEIDTVMTPRINQLIRERADGIVDFVLYLITR